MKRKNKIMVGKQTNKQTFSSLMLLANDLFARKFLIKFDNYINFYNDVLLGF